MSNAWTGVGTDLLRGDGAPTEAFVVVPEVISIGGPQITKGDIEVTNLDSTAKEFISDLKDNGALDCEMNWLPNDATQTLVRSDAEGSTGGNWRIIWPATGGNVQVDFFAEVNSFTINTEPGAQATASWTLKISGALTWS